MLLQKIIAKFVWEVGLQAELFQNSQNEPTNSRDQNTSWQG